MNPSITDVKVGDYVKLIPFPPYAIPNDDNIYFEGERQITRIDNDSKFPIIIDRDDSSYNRYARYELLVKGADYT